VRVERKTLEASEQILPDAVWIDMIEPTVVAS
jgi:hypothetical protein